MPFNYNRDTYAQILEKAKATLAAKTDVVVVVEDPLLDELAQLKVDAKTLAKKFGKNAPTFGTATFANLTAVTKGINELEPGQADYAKLIDAYRDELDAAATWYDVVFAPTKPPAGPPAADGSIFDDIRNAPKILNEVSPYELLNYNLANALLKPSGRSAFYQRGNDRTLTEAAAAATAWLIQDRVAAPAAAAPAASAVAASAAAAAAAPVVADELSLLIALYIDPPEAGARMARFFEIKRLGSAKEVIDFLDGLPARSVRRAKRLLDSMEAERDAGPLPDIAVVEDFINGALIVTKRS